ncbi:thiol-disulfide oxidoreductase DCC family protein [Paenibacillus sp. PL2-23]|uniref:thiol-disulfide oxidoreductase DCC family protein n=1 Tax=Paenibacillus sp. PL2-23 TaxID=2100729 RepID=UPI0030F5AAFD
MTAANKPEWKHDSGEPAGPVLLIDGVCHLCHGVTRYVVKHDHRRRFSFAALQSDAGKRLLRAGGLDETKWDSFVYVDNGRYYRESSAALRVCKGLGGWRMLLYGLIVIPKPIRDAVYRWIAANRYKWFGRSEACLIPGPDVMSRFLENGLVDSTE